MFLTLGVAAAFVAVIGLYGVRSYLVTRRTREFGVRMAVGASPADVLRAGAARSDRDDDGGTRDRPGAGRVARVGIERRDLPDQPVRSGHAWRRDRIAGGVIDRRVVDSGATSGQRDADDGVAE